MSNVSISKNDLLATIAHYRSSVEAQQGSATPYPEDRKAELGQIDAFAKSVQGNAGATAQEMIDTERASAAASLKTFKAWNNGSFFGGAALMALGALPAVSSALGPIPSLVGVVVIFGGSMVARVKGADYSRANNFANQLENYKAYAEGQIAQNPPGVGPIPQPAICPMPPQVAAQPPGAGNNEPAVCAQPPA